MSRRTILINLQHQEDSVAPFLLISCDVGKIRYSQMLCSPNSDKRRLGVLLGTNLKGFDDIDMMRPGFIAEMLLLNKNEGYGHKM